VFLKDCQLKLAQENEAGATADCPQIIYKLRAGFHFLVSYLNRLEQPLI